MSSSGISLVQNLKEKQFPEVPFIICTSGVTPSLRKLSLRAGVAEIFSPAPSKEGLEIRLCFLIDNWQFLKQETKAAELKLYHTPLLKRLFDVVFAGTALLLLSPFFLIVALLLKLESKGPVFYYALRVGTGYKLFKFYKFRSMYINADQKLKDLKHLNQYNNKDVKGEEAVATETITKVKLCNECAAAGTGCQSLIYADKVEWCERQYISHKKANSGSAFIKIKNDPRITKVGNFIRNLSIDELPQLWNVVIGDMSIVGNRPLPLYEAEQLTTDEYVLRFLAPAGITGLWQVEKRGKGEMSEQERLMLDNVYAKDHSFLKDMKLIFKTVPALFQKENV
ncbi:MAG: sugar transferase [Bacteroidota bacterium]|nr:sugar transferase [Bacteroidota bacterium]